MFLKKDSKTPGGSFCPSQLMPIFTSVLKNEKVESDIPFATKKGQAAFDTFMKTILSKEKTMTQ